MQPLTDRKQENNWIVPLFNVKEQNISIFAEQSFQSMWLKI